MSDFTSAKTSHRHGVVSVLVALPFVSLTGLFGKFLTFSPLLIVQGRTVFAFGALLLALFFLRKKIFFSDLREWLWLALSGSILGVHWIAFFQAIQVSTVAIGLLSFASYPLFTTLLEPLFFREPLRVRNVFAALIVICGLALMATSGSDDSNTIISGSVFHGILWGLMAGFGFAVLTLLNRGHVRKHSALLITCWQNGFAALVILPWSIFESWILQRKRIRFIVSSWSSLYSRRPHLVDQRLASCSCSSGKFVDCRTGTGFCYFVCTFSAGRSSFFANLAWRCLNNQHYRFHNLRY